MMYFERSLENTIETPSYVLKKKNLKETHLKIDLKNDSITFRDLYSEITIVFEYLIEWKTHMGEGKNDIHSVSKRWLFEGFFPRKENVKL